MALFPAPNQVILRGTIRRTTTSSLRLAVSKRIRATSESITDCQDKDSLFGCLSWSNTDQDQRRSRFPGALDASPFTGASETDLGAKRAVSYTRVWTPRS